MINPRLRPWFRLIGKVKAPFIGAVICGVIYGIASGFGLPFMTRTVFPVLFATSPVESNTELGVRVSSGDILPLQWREGWYWTPEQTGEDEPSQKPESVPVAMDRETPVLSPDPLLRETEWKLPAVDDPVKITGPLYWIDRRTGEMEEVDSSPVNFLMRLHLPRWQMLLLAVGLVPITFAIRGVSAFLNVYLINYTGLRVLEDIRGQMFEKIQKLDIPFFTNHSQGDLLSRLFNDTTQLQHAVVNVANDLIKQPITFLGAMTYLVYTSIQKSEIAFILFSLAVIPVCVLPIRYAGKRLLKKALQMQQQTGRANALVQENLSGYREVRAFNLQKRESGRFIAAIRDLFREQMKIVKYSSFLSPTIEFISALGISVAIFYAAGKGITLEDFTPLIMALYLSYEPVKKLGAIHNHVKKGIASLDRIEEILDYPVRINPPANPEPFPSAIETLSLDDVAFSYDESIPVLTGVGFEARMGQSIALVGPSGAGKSTLIQLLCRFFDPTSGAIRINGTDIRQFNPQDLRQHIALVSQETVLFNDTVENNIRLGNPDAHSDEVLAAATNAQALDFIRELPHQFLTSIGERGNKLSGGQKQRISIARAFLKDAPIIIFDEATSALDTESESRVQKAMSELIRGRMAWIIAHRLSTVQHADVIIVMEKGRIVDTGTHESLLLSCPLYQQLVSRQSLQ